MMPTQKILIIKKKKSKNVSNLYYWVFVKKNTIIFLSRWLGMKTSWITRNSVLIIQTFLSIIWSGFVRKRIKYHTHGVSFLIISCLSNAWRVSNCREYRISMRVCTVALWGWLIAGGEYYFINCFTI